MTRQYRAYLVGEDGVFRSAEAFEAPSDSSALTFAQRFTRHGRAGARAVPAAVAGAVPIGPARQ